VEGADFRPLSVRVLFSLLLCYARRVQVQTTPPAPPPMPDLSWMAELLFLLLALGLLVWVAYRLWSRASSPMMKVIAHLPLEPRRSLYIVNVAGQFLLLGAGEGGLSNLATLDGEQVKAALQAASQGEKPLLVRLMEILRSGASPTVAAQRSPLSISENGEGKVSSPEGAPYSGRCAGPPGHRPEEAGK
jgi:flagellar biogenesis protein FliO